MPNTKNASNVDLRLCLLTPLQIHLLPALFIALEQDINSRCRLASWASHTGSTADSILAEERLDLALPPPSPTPSPPSVARRETLAPPTHAVSLLDAVA